MNECIARISLFIYLYKCFSRGISACLLIISGFGCQEDGKVVPGIYKERGGGEMNAVASSYPVASLYVGDLHSDVT